MCSHVQQPRFEAQNSLDEAKEVNVKQQAEDEKTVVKPTNDAAPMSRKISKLCQQAQTCHEVLGQTSNSNLPPHADQLAISQNDTKNMYHTMNENHKAETLGFAEVQSKYDAFITIQHKPLRRKHAGLVQSRLADGTAYTQTTEDFEIQTDRCDGRKLESRVGDQAHEAGYGETVRSGNPSTRKQQQKSPFSRTSRPIKLPSAMAFSQDKNSSHKKAIHPSKSGTAISTPVRKTDSPNHAKRPRDDKEAITCSG
ncbi:MAG: hypothetical protein ASARMPRED_008118 [Alectoria sarmentosa]|nr:MAG: hypothetical protein ASARMPRED_008118 [Alectoria sarmentosa]